MTPKSGATLFKISVMAFNASALEPSYEDFG